MKGGIKTSTFNGNFHEFLQKKIESFSEPNVSALILLRVLLFVSKFKLFHYPSYLTVCHP